MQFFSTLIIKDKLKYDFYQIDENEIGHVHGRLVNAIRTFTTPSKAVLNNLALSLVYLYIHCVSKVGTIMQFFANTFPSDSTMPEGCRFLYFFKFLEMLP